MYKRRYTEYARFLNIEILVLSQRRICSFVLNAHIHRLLTSSTITTIFLYLRVFDRSGVPVSIIIIVWSKTENF